MNRDYVLEAAENNPWYLEAAKNPFGINVFQPLRLPSIKWRESRPSWIANDILNEAEMELLSSVAGSWNKSLRRLDFGRFDEFDSVEINDAWNVVDTAVDMDEVNGTIFDHLALKTFTMNTDKNTFFFTTLPSGLQGAKTAIRDYTFGVEPILLIYLKDEKSKKPRTSHIIVQTRIFLPQNGPFNGAREWYPAPILIDSRDPQISFVTSRVSGCLYTELFLYVQHALLNRPEIIVEQPVVKVLSTNTNSARKNRPVKDHHNIKTTRRVYTILGNDEPSRKYKRHTRKWTQAGYIDKNGRKVRPCIKGPDRLKPDVPITPKNYMLPNSPD